MRVYRQKNSSNIKIHVHKGDIDYNKAVDCLTEIALFAPKLESTWYDEASDYASELSEIFEVDYDKVCKVIAVLSPMQRWNTNKKMAYRCLLSWRSGVRTNCHMFSKMTKKAYDILDGKEIKSLGPKVGPFYETILNPVKSTTPTIDSIAMSIILDMHDLPGSYKITPSQLKVAQRVYNEVAKNFGVPVTQLQAATWCYSREKKDANKGIGKTMLEVYETNSSVSPYQFAENLRTHINESK